MTPAAAAGAAVGAAGVLALALGFGWVAPAAPPSPVLALLHGRAPQPVQPIRRPGGDMIFALDGLVGELGGAPAAAGPVIRARFVAPPPPLPPPPPDVALVLRREASAVVRQPGGSLGLLLAQPGQRARLLRPGDLFDDRWRLASLTMDQAVLSDGVSERRVSLFAGPGPGGAYSGGAYPQ